MPDISIELLVSEEDIDLLQYIVLRPRKQAFVDGKPVMSAYYGRKRRPLHRVIMQRMQGGKKVSRVLMVDHINGNPLDNRRENLRLATARQNAANRRVRTEGRSSQYKGVSKSGSKWRAYVSEPAGDGAYRRIALGTFEEEKDAALAYNQWMLDTHGEFALLNIIEEGT